MSGKLKNTKDSSTSMPSAKKPTKKILEIPSKPDVLPTIQVLSRSSPSPLAEVYETEQFKNEWANDVRFHVARNLVHLRRYRKMSQDAVGKAVGTSQSAVARIESAQENITVDTLQRFIVALNGRLHIAIPPQEHSLPLARPWWDASTLPTESSWSEMRILARQTAVGIELAISANTSMGLPLSLLAEAQISAIQY